MRVFVVTSHVFVSYPHQPRGGELAISLHTLADTRTLHCHVTVTSQEWRSWCTSTLKSLVSGVPRVCESARALSCQHPPAQNAGRERCPLLQMYLYGGRGGGGGGGYYIYIYTYHTHTHGNLVRASHATQGHYTSKLESKLESKSQRDRPWTDKPSRFRVKRLATGSCVSEHTFSLNPKP